MPARLVSLRAKRISKLKEIRALGVNPYPSVSRRTHSASSAKEMLDREVRVAGRIFSWREHGGSIFADLKDESGKIQIFFKRDVLGKERYDFLKLLDIGDFLEVEGKVFKTYAGELTVLVSDFTLLTKSLRPLPSKWYGLKDVEERFRRRYLDLIMNPEVREMFIKKSRFWSSIREYLTNQGFLEVETPVLEAVPGGADARPFITHHYALDTDFYLRISLELHLKRLIVGGFEKIFEIGRVFRNEGIDAEHLQDYTQMEFYWAYANYEDLMDFLEDFYRYVIEKTIGGLKSKKEGKEINWGKKWERIDYSQIFWEIVKINPLKAGREELLKKAKELKLKPEEFLGKGRLMDLIYKKTIRPRIIGPAFLINLPVEVSPLAKRIPDNPNLTERILVLAGGTELGNGFSELNDPLDQKERFEEQQKLREAGDEEAQMYDKDFIEALEYGMPPTAGFGLSERLFSFLMNKPIRECVFFPLMKKRSGRKRND